MTKPKKLLEQVKDQIKLCNYSHRTEESYILWIKKYIYFFQKNILLNVKISRRCKRSAGLSC